MKIYLEILKVLTKKELSGKCHLLYKLSRRI